MKKHIYEQQVKQETKHRHKFINQNITTHTKLTTGKTSTYITII